MSTTEEQFQIVLESITDSAWGQDVTRQDAPPLARDILYSLDQAGWLG